MNKKAIIAAIALTCLLVLVGGSISYFTTTGDARNAVTSSALDIELVMEEEVDGVKSPSSGSVGIMPGETKSRIASVKNTNREPAWIRVSVEVETAEGATSIADSHISLGDLDDTNWKYQEGYWYYGKALEPGETTEPLFTSVTLPGDVGNDLSGKEISLNVNAEGTQVKNNGSSAMDAKGWPEA